MNAPTEMEPYLFVCPSCHGSGCRECKDGRVELTTCPLTVLDARLSRVMRFARYAAELKIMPVAGGMLDQNPVFLEAMALIESDRASWRAHFSAS